MSRDSFSNKQGHFSSSQQSQISDEEKKIKDFCKLIKERNFMDDKVFESLEAFAKALVYKKDSKVKGKEDTTTQISKFYNLVRVAESQTKDLAKLKIKLHLLKAQISYANGRGTISDSVQEFLTIAISKVLENKEDKIAKSLEDFATLFEAFYAYFYFYTKNFKGGN